MNEQPRCCLTRDLILPTLLFTAMGGMTWAVRGSSGYGASAGCIFAGVLWGAGWWYLSYEPRGPQTRRYSSAWIILAITLGIGYAGSRGWMQWTHFFEGHLSTNYAKNEYVPIPKYYGSLWLFIAGVPWAGLGACLLAWCGSIRETRACQWLLRIAMGVGGAYLGGYCFKAYPEYFLPLYSTIKDRYEDLEANPSLLRLINDNRAATFHMGYYLGFLLYELVRRDWKNVILILTVGLLNGLGWGALQHWKWAPALWPNFQFNWWRCWESSGGLSIGFSFGIAYFLVNRPMSLREMAVMAVRRSIEGPTFEGLIVFLGLASYSSLFLYGQTVNRYPFPSIQKPTSNEQAASTDKPATSEQIATNKKSERRGQGRSRGRDGDQEAGTSITIAYSTFCLTILDLFALAYYLKNRSSSKTTVDGPNQLTTGKSWTNVETGALVLTAAHLAIIWAPQFVGPTRGRESKFAEIILLSNAAITGLGIVWSRANRSRLELRASTAASQQGDPNLQRLGLHIGLLFGLLHSARSGLKGWFNIYKGNEDYWSRQLWYYIGPALVLGILIVSLWALLRPKRIDDNQVLFPHAYGAIWLVLIVQNTLGQLVTGPWSNWVEVQFSLYYLQLFLLTAIIVEYYRLLKKRNCESQNAAAS